MRKSKKRANIASVIDNLNYSISKNIGFFNKQLTRIRKNFVKYHEPYSEISQNHNGMDIRINLPSIPKKNILLKINNGRIEVSGHMLERKRLLKGFYRSIDLPSNAVADKARARYKNNTLRIRIPIVHQNI